MYASDVPSEGAFVAIRGQALGRLSDEPDGPLHLVQSEEQIYAGLTTGLTFGFNSPIASLGEAASRLTFVFKTKAVAPTNSIAIQSGIEYQLSNLAAGSTVKTVDAASYVDGSDDASYATLQVLEQGIGFKCWSSRQCAGRSIYCYNAVCTHYSQLSAEAQEQVDKVYRYGPPDNSAMVASVALASEYWSWGNSCVHAENPSQSNEIRKPVSSTARTLKKPSKTTATSSEGTPSSFLPNRTRACNSAL
jgi:hypothetical protein